MIDVFKSYNIIIIYKYDINSAQDRLEIFFNFKSNFWNELKEMAWYISCTFNVKLKSVF